MRAGLPKRERMPSCSSARGFMPVCGRTSKKALSGRFKNRTSWVRFLTRVCSANSGTYGVSGVRAGTYGANASPAAGFPRQLWRNGVPGVRAGTDKRLIFGREYGQDARAGKCMASFRQKTRDKKHTRMYAFYRILKELQARRSNSEPLSVIWKMGWVLGKGRNF